MSDNSKNNNNDKRKGGNNKLKKPPIIITTAFVCLSPKFIFFINMLIEAIFRD